MQVDAAVQLPAAPLQPTCHLIFKTGPCADSWRNYNQAVQQWNQLYVKQQQQTAASQATAPLQHQIADEHQQMTTLQEQVTTLQKQMQADATAALQQTQAASTVALQAQRAAHTQGLQQGAGIGVGASLILFALIFGIKKLMSGFTVTKKAQARAASA